MPDFQSPEDEATLYVLGELTAAERREFETRMAKSTELRALVRQLEEGMVALSTGLPRRRPPAEVWSGIEREVCRERRLGVAAWWKNCWRNGWAAAALCLMGWLLYAILLNGRNNVKMAAPQSAPPHETVVANTSPATLEHTASLPPRSTNAERQLLQVRAEEISDLRFKIAAMAQETNELAQLLAQERARLGETNRIKFYQMTSAFASNGDATTSKLSPAMQRAMLISIGRELGWVPMASKPHTGNAHAASTIDGIDFVDLRSPNGSTGNQSANQSANQPVNQQPSQPAGQPQVESQVTDVTEPSVPAFVSGDKLIVGLDSSVVPPNSSVTLSLAGTSAGFTPTSYAVTGWNFMVGDNPTMVTIPLTVASPDGRLILTVNSFTAAGVSNTAQFFAPANP